MGPACPQNPKPHPPPYDPALIQDYIICRGGGRLDKLQVIKIACIAYGHVLAQSNVRLFRGGQEAWAYGPVVSAMYESLKEFHGPIDVIPYSGIPLDGGPEFQKSLAFMAGVMDPEIRGILDVVVEEYGRLSGAELLRLTHLKGSPWARAYRRGEHHTPIPDKIIRDYYLNIAKECKD